MDGKMIFCLVIFSQLDNLFHCYLNLAPGVVMKHTPVEQERDKQRERSRLDGL